ncbi:uncharacterized protein LOC116179635 [Photinus pyralis]|uniref:uncharacterized protein LOC116179635 n=1 Tax=Photinus pyralis TaxID=7054 RepID=UPI0012676A84|nr:uncharacterized protein LOC116179635 [Photinus pyralis]
MKMNILTSIVFSVLIANARSQYVNDEINPLGLNDAKYYSTAPTNAPDATTIPDVGDATFGCRTAGMYPDPFDCNRYHHCARHGNDGWTKSPLEHYSDTCNCGYAYNARTTFCDISLRNGTCNSDPVAACRHVGQNGVMKYNPSVYYICQYHPNGPLYPFMYACENGKKYNTYLYLCE